MLTEKRKRTLLFVAQRLCSWKALIIPKSINDIPLEQYFTRELHLKENRTVFLSDFGYEQFRTVVEILAQADLFDGLAEYSDIWSASRKVLEMCLSDGVQPESANELIQAVAKVVEPDVDDYTYIVPIFGISLDDTETLSLGKMTVLHMSSDVLDLAGIEHSHTDIPRLLELNKGYLWLKGTTRGTPNVARRAFSEQATLTVGMLAIAAASLYECGATRFRIGTVMSTEEAIGRSVWFSWRERDRSLATSYAFPSAQLLPVNKIFDDESDLGRLIHRSFEVIQKQDKTELEEAIARAAYWYSDAHRDPVGVMQLVKYWSCVEAFFSFEKDEPITHAVSTGLASILVFGGFRFVPVSEYVEIKRKIVDLYDLRSQAVHGGVHHHTTERDIAQFSQWVAWMIVSMLALLDLGYTALKEVKTQTERLNTIVENGKKN